MQSCLTKLGKEECDNCLLLKTKAFKCLSQPRKKYESGCKKLFFLLFILIIDSQVVAKKCTMSPMHHSLSLS